MGPPTNWFERYGITGAYFVITTIAWFYALNPKSNIWEYNHIVSIAVSTAAVLPLGFIIASLSHRLYYRPRYCFLWGFLLNKIYRPQIHRESYRRIRKFKILPPDTHSEERLETILSKILRLDVPKCKIEATKWYSELMTKRWGGIAISSNLMLATLLSILSSGFLTLGLLFTSWSWQPDLFILVILLIIVILVCISLFGFRKVMSRQVLDLLGRLYESLDNNGQLAKEIELCIVKLEDANQKQTNNT